MTNSNTNLGPPPPIAHAKAEDDKHTQKVVKGAGFGPAYTFMRFVGERSAAHFFRRVLVVGGERVPKKGTYILCCTHFSTLMDVAIISAELDRPIHYWAKRGLYKRQPFRWILENSGNIQVNRKEKSNEDLFAGTFQAMKAGEPIGLFPEGGSYTEHRLHSMKAGAAWAALEYAKHLLLQGEIDDPAKSKVTIVPAAINYTDKSRFRSEAVFEFGQPFTVDEYMTEFMSKAVEGENGNLQANNAFASALSDTGMPPTPGPSVIVNGTNGPHPPSRMRLGLDVGTATSADEQTAIKAKASKAPSNTTSARTAVSKLTDRIGTEIYKMTIDAPDWTTWHSVKMARELIWKKNGQLPLRDLVPISNALVAVLNAPIPQAKTANETLCALQGLALASSTDVYTLNALAKLFSLPRRAMQPAAIGTGDEDEDLVLPTRRRAERAVPGILPATLYLIRQILALTIRLPYVLPLALMYVPAYSISWYLAKKYSSHEEESMASAKSLCAFVIAGLTHVGLVICVAAPFLFTPLGWILGIALSVIIEKSHVWLLDETYSYIKKLVISWRMFLAASTVYMGERQFRQLGGQLGRENHVVRLAVDVVKSQQGIQWSLIKALRTASRDAKVRENGFSSGGDGAVSENDAAPVRPKIFNRSGRPACYRLMGVTRLVHAQAVQALHDLLEKLDTIERQGQKEAVIIEEETLQKYRYLREQMQNTKATVMPASRRYTLRKNK
jgi:1-acyl-sn-glycerol-3-phosphate acyltransferase